MSDNLLYSDTTISYCHQQLLAVSAVYLLVFGSREMAKMFIDLNQIFILQVKFVTGQSDKFQSVDVPLCIKMSKQGFDVCRPYSEFLYKSELYPKTAFFHSLEKYTYTETHDMSSAV